MLSEMLRRAGRNDVSFLVSSFIVWWVWCLFLYFQVLKGYVFKEVQSGMLLD